MKGIEVVLFYIFLFFGNEGNLLKLVLGQASGQLLKGASAQPGGSGCLATDPI